MRVYLQTRGTARATDYAFLGDAPPEPWWRDYRDVTAFDHPTVLVSSDGRRWAAYLSGIPSSRVDAVGTVVRYTLVLDGSCAAPETACVAAAVGAWLDDVATGHGARPGGRLAAALDARFPAGDVERRLTGHPRPDSDDVRQRALTALASLPVPAPTADVAGSWVGGTASAPARAAFRARVRLLLDGTPGRALLLNLLGGRDDAAALLDPAAPVAVLVEGADPPVPLPAHPAPSVVGAKKAPVPPARRAGVLAVGIAVVPLVALLGALAATALVVTLLVWLL